MPLNPAFSIGQIPATPNIVVAIDESTGSDVLVTQRRIFIQDSQGNYLVPSGTTTNYTQWAIADASINLNILTEDEAVEATVQWLDVTNVVLYELANPFCLAEYSKNFFYYLVQLVGDEPSIPADTNYNSNSALFWARVEGAMNAVVNNSDIAGSQNCLNKATQMRLNQSLYF